MDYTKLQDIPGGLDFTKWNSRLENYIDLYIDKRKAARDGIYKARSGNPKEFADREHLTAMCDNRLLILLNEAHKVNQDTYERVLKKIVNGVPENVATSMRDAIDNPGDGLLFKPINPKL